jgi:hypothetical protein
MLESRNLKLSPDFTVSQESLGALLVGDFSVPISSRPVDSDEGTRGSDPDGSRTRDLPRADSTVVLTLSMFE